MAALEREKGGGVADRPSTIPSVVRQAVLDGALASAHGRGMAVASRLLLLDKGDGEGERDR